MKEERSEAMRMRRGKVKQGLFAFPNGWGGWRKGSGRKPKGRKKGVSHRTRPLLESRLPVHVTLKLIGGLPSLRREQTRARLLLAFAASNEKGLVRIVEYSIQGNHVHFLIEAKDRDALARGVQGLSIRIARSLNKGWGRTGGVFVDRYHARILESPQEVRNALVYVLQNARHHGVRSKSIDPFSSGGDFDGWFDDLAENEAERRRQDSSATKRIPALPPETWLLGNGWRRHGLIGIEEEPR